MLDHRDAALLHDGALERLAAARDHDVDAVVAAEQRRAPPRGRRSTSCTAVGRQARVVDGGADRRRRWRALVACDSEPPFSSTAFAVLRQSAGRVGGDVRARLVDREHDADRDAHLRDLEPVRPPPRGDRLADRVGQGGDLLEPARHGLDARRRERQAIEERAGVAARPRARSRSLAIGREQRRLGAPQSARPRRAARVLGRGGRARRARAPPSRAARDRASRRPARRRARAACMARTASAARPRVAAAGRRLARPRRVTTTRSSRWMTSSLPL